MVKGRRLGYEGGYPARAAGVRGDIASETSRRSTRGELVLLSLHTDHDGTYGKR